MGFAVREISKFSANSFDELNTRPRPTVIRDGVFFLVTAGIHLMFRRILIAEKWRWYVYDVALPLSAGTLTAVLARVALPHPVTAVQQFLGLAAASILTLASSMLASGNVRTGVSCVVAKFCSRLRFTSASFRQP